MSNRFYKTVNLFKKIGMDLNIIEGFSSKKEIVNFIVSKRNKIVHHNDNANDVSMIDLIDYINSFVDYIKLITESVEIENLKLKD